MDRILVSRERASSTSWKKEDPDVRRPNSLMSASVLRSGGCSAFVKTGLSNPCPVEGVLRHWRSTRGRSSPSSARNKMSLGHSHQLKHVSVWIFEVNASAAVPIIELAVIEAPGSAAV